MEIPCDPSPRRYLVHSAAAVRWAAASAFVEKYAASGVSIVAATRMAADRLVWQICRQGGVGDLWGVRRWTALQLAGELAVPTLARDGKTPLWGLSQEALAVRVLASCAESLATLAPVARTPGMARALVRSLRELSLAGVRPEELEDLGPVARDIALLQRRFSHLLRELAVADDAELYAAAEAALERQSAAAGDAAAPGMVTSSAVLFLDVSPRHPAEAAFLAALGRGAPTFFATVAAGDTEAELFFADLACAETVDAITSDEQAAPRTRLERLRSQLFAAEDGAPCPPDPSFEWFSAPGEGRECTEIARRILEGMASIPFDEIAIALRNPEQYFPLLEEALGRAQIPFFFSQGTRRPDPAGRAFLALIACADERLSASRFAEYLSLDQVPALDAAGAPPPRVIPWVEPKGEQLVLGSPEPEPSPSVAGKIEAPRRWENLLVDAAVIDGADRWQRRLDGIENELRLQWRDLEDGDLTGRQRLERDLFALQQLRRFALPLIDDLAAWPRHATWEIWLGHLEALAARALREPERVLATLAELRPLGSALQVGLDEVRRVLEERLTLLRSPPREKSAGRVLIGTPDELRGQHFHTVFVPGLAEGLFPRRSAEDPLLLDELRQQLAAKSGRVLVLADQRVARERLLLRLAVGAARERLVSSYPNLDTLAGRARVPSFYALDLLRAAAGELPDIATLEAQAAEASSALLGWPGPRLPEAAIDDAEFDIAMLAELGRQHSELSRGQARYLLETNPRLQRSLRNRYSRFTSRKLSRADGLVVAADDPASLQILAAHRLAERPYSPTALQHYAACPLRFFYQAILGLRPRDRAERLQQLDPLTRGALFHEVQFHLQRDLQTRQLLPVGPAELGAAMARADFWLEQVATDYAEKLAPAIPRVYTSEIAALRLDLRAWLHTVAAEKQPFRPARFELAFGLPADEGHDRESVTTPVTLELTPSSNAAATHRARVRGSIDLVEESLDGAVLRVTDHKTGLPPKTPMVLLGQGELLQPLLYALVAEHMLQRPVVSGRLFYCTRRGGQKVVEITLDERGRAAMAQVVSTIDQAVAEGFLPAMPRQDACQRCDYRTVCGPLEEQRVRRKNRDRLVALDELRRRA